MVFGPVSCRVMLVEKWRYWLKGLAGGMLIGWRGVRGVIRLLCLKEVNDSLVR